MADHIVVTGAAGFIGSCLAHHLNKTQDKPILLVDDFSFPEKNKNLVGLDAHVRIEREEFVNQLNDYSISAIFHIGARTDTTEFDTSIFEYLNVNYTKTLWKYATEKNIPFIYASSAATYGEGELGFDDDNSAIHKLKPLNPYGQSKQDIDQWILEQTKTPDFWVGLKFFNVFGPNEYHKGRMASVVMHAFNQIKQTGKMKLFKSHRPDYTDGGQTRDFIYVKDLISVMMFWYRHQKNSGIYNLGTGTPRTFKDLATAVFSALNMEHQIEYIPTPEDIRDKYQYYTKAEMQRTLDAGYSDGFHSLEDAVNDNVNRYLARGNHYSGWNFDMS